MCYFLVVRHGPTQWNVEKKLQGHTDIPLTSDAKASLAHYTIPPPYDHWPVFSSPLTRASETAKLLSGYDPSTLEALKEMNFGGWEGQKLKDLRAGDPDGMRLMEDKGWHMTPPDGESPWDVKIRMQPLMEQQKSKQENRVYVAHKGVMRVMMAWAMHWDFMGKPPIDLDFSACHLFKIDRALDLKLIQSNIPLARKE